MEELLLATVGSAGNNADTYVNFDYTGTEAGSFPNPFNTLFEAEAFAATNGDIYIAPGASTEILALDLPENHRKKRKTPAPGNT
jgi:hypothetical protein